jgi:hypothetical protein
MKSSLPLVFGLIAPANVLGTVADLLNASVAKSAGEKGSGGLVTFSAPRFGQAHGHNGLP